MIANYFFNKQHRFPTKFLPYYDGLNDYSSVASHSTIDNIFHTGGTVFTSYRVRGRPQSDPMLWAKTDGLTKGSYLQLFGSGTAGVIYFFHLFSTTAGLWTLNYNFNYAIPEEMRIVVAYDASDVANDPVIHLNGQKYHTGDGSLIEFSTPVGAVVSDAGIPLILGMSSAGANINSCNGEIWDVGMQASEVSDANAGLDWVYNGFADTDFVARWKFNDFNYPTDNAPNSGTGAAPHSVVTGAISQNHFTRHYSW